MGPALYQVRLCDGCSGNPGKETPGRESWGSSYPNCPATQSLGLRKGKGSEEETRMRVILPAKTDGRHWVWCRERGWEPPGYCQRFPGGGLSLLCPSEPPTTSTGGQLPSPQL